MKGISGTDTLESTPVADQQVTVANFKLIKVHKTGHRADHDEIACLDVIVSGFRFCAELRFDGSIQLPRGVDIPVALRRRARETAQQLALAELTKMWSQHRDSGEA